VATSAVVSTSVQELIDGVPGSVNSDRKQLGVDSPQPPLDVAADLVSTDLNGNLVSLGQGFGRFADPDRLNQANPQEFAIEVECYSNTASVSYAVQSNATESRTILFRGSGGLGNPPEIQFRSDGTRSIESRIFVTGALVFWSTTKRADFSDMTAEMQFRVEHAETGESLFDSALVLTETGASEISPTVSGPLQVRPVNIDELAALGADAESIGVLEQVAEIGTLAIFVIPTQQHRYTYTVRADEPMTLDAVLEARIRNAPDGTGVAAVLGRPFKNLADFIELGLPGVDGQTLERSLNQATSMASDKPATNRPASTALCGSFGMELAMFAAFSLFLTHRTRISG